MSKEQNILAQIEGLNEQQLRRLLVEHLTRQKLGLYWESSAIERDQALNSDLVLPQLVEAWSHRPAEMGADLAHRNLIIEGDNFDSLRLLKATHAGKIRVIYIDPPYNTGNKDWVYNDSYVGQNDRWRHSQWLEFLYRRLTLARDLLTPDGVILVSINDENRARLEMLMDDVFPGMRLGSLVWRTRQGSNADQNCFLSVDHEHILVYGNQGFKFNGFDKSYEMYSNPNNDPRGDWRIGDITLGFSYKERPNLYYPLTDPNTGITYPCSPESVWRFATESRVKDGQRLQAKSMEEYIRLGQIIFPSNPKTKVWNSLDELHDDIDNGVVPKGGKSLLLRRDLPDLESWIGKVVGFGRPQFKRYKADLRNQTQPLSSWIVPSLEDQTYDCENSMVVGTNQEASQVITDIFGDKAFNYTKPLTLIKNLLSQSGSADDIFLDFFAGSGTTAQAVLELNAEDNGFRRFILCSSTEATDNEPDKNLCRDICAERVRRVVNGYGNNKGFSLRQGGEFAYLQLEKVNLADVHFETKPEQTFQLIALKRLGVVPPVPSGSIQKIGRLDDCDLLVCHEVNQATVETLINWPKKHGVARLAIYSTRPDTLRDKLSANGVEANCYSLLEALIQGQTQQTWGVA